MMRSKKRSFGVLPVRVSHSQHVAVAFAAIASYARGHDVGWLGNAAVSDSNNVIPCLCWLAAVSALPFKLLQQELLCFGGNRVNGAFAVCGMGQPCCSESLRILIAAPSFSVCARLTQSAVNVANEEPRLAASAPSPTDGGRSPPLRFCWPWRISLRSTLAANISASITTRPINLKPLQRSVLAAATALFLAVCGPRDEAPVRRAAILRGAHAP